jgi:hypothetical protein
MSLIDPRTNAPFTSCSYSTSDGRTGSLSPCRIQTRNSGGSIFNGVWLRFEMTMPSTYTCTGTANGCWWKVRYEFSGASQPNDRVTVRVTVRGDPIRLVR